MAVLGIISVILGMYSVVAWAVTGRALYLSAWLWFLPIACMVFGKSKDVNGLVVLIAIVYTIELLYCLNGVRLWNTDNIRCNKVFLGITVILNLAVSLYFSVESYVFGYMPFFSIFENIGVYFSILWGFISAAISVRMGIIAFDKYFSKKQKFVIIKCSSYRGRGKFNMRIKGIRGVQNGVEYVFRATNKGHYMLKNEKSLVMDVKKGVLGGMYVSGGELFKNKIRQARHINKVLIKKGIFAFVSVWVLVLFVFRVILGMNFESIFSAFINVVLF